MYLLPCPGLYNIIVNDYMYKLVILRVFINLLLFSFLSLF